MDSDEVLAQCSGNFVKVEGVISAETSDAFRTQFESLCKSDPARKMMGIVYVWSTVRPIPRIKGESNVLYIGQTSQSFYNRHHRYAKTEANGLNWARYQHAIESYGILPHVATSSVDQILVDRKVTVPLVDCNETPHEIKRNCSRGRSNISAFLSTRQ